MIRQILHQLDTMKQTNQTSWRELCDLVPYASVMRWRKRQRLGIPLWQCPGPKKSLPLDWSEFYPLLRQLNHGRVRTQGTSELYERFAQFLSRRQLRSLVQDYRQDQLHSMKHIYWLWSGLAWSLDATEYDLGADHYLRTGEVLPDATLDELRAFDAILLGSVGPPSKIWPHVIGSGHW